MRNVTSISGLINFVGKTNYVRVLFISDGKS